MRGVGVTLDLIPVDAVVDEMLALEVMGAASAGRTFHVTAAEPLALGDVLRELSPMSGVALGVTEPGTAGPEAALVMRRLKHYMPYFAYARRFERGPPPQGAFRLDVAGLRGFVRSFVAQQGEA